MTKRIKIPVSCQHVLYYRCAGICCVCQKNRASHIHHINKNPSDNEIDNLVFLCSSCHDEAHTEHKLSANLTPGRLSNLKKQWEIDISRRATNAMLPVWGDSSYASWVYFNIPRFKDYMDRFNVSFDKKIYKHLLAHELVSEFGMPLWEKQKNNGLTTIFDCIDHLNSRNLYEMYCKATNDIIAACCPVEFLYTNKVSEIKSVVHESSFIFLQKGFYFRNEEILDSYQLRVGYTKARNIRLEFLIDTRYVYGNSALYSSLRRHNTIFAFLFVKSIERIDRAIVFKTSPVALGYGFYSSRKDSPYQEMIERNSSVGYGGNVGEEEIY